jgi:hypothetical protein
MKRIVLTKKSIDRSDTGHFSFSFFCDRCEKEWLSLEKPFSGGICSRVEKNEALKLLWGNEHRTAFDEAQLEAHTQFNRCPLCNKWVCDDCFCLDGIKGGVCKDCNGS